MQESFSITPIKRGIAVLSLLAVSLAAGIYATKALALECVNEPDDHLKSWCASIPGGHHPDAPPKEGESRTTRNDPNWDSPGGEQDSIKGRNKNLQNTEKYKDWQLTDSSGKGVAVFVNETGAVVPTSDNSHSWEAKQKAGGGEVNKQSIAQESGWDYIYFICDRCSKDRKCETGVGENPNFSFGTSSDPCAQVDRRKKGASENEGWQAVSLCDASCSGGGTTTRKTDNGKKPPKEPTPKPELACKSLKGSTATPKVGQTVTLTCKASGSKKVDHFEFRYKIGTGAFTNLPAGTAQEKDGDFVGTSQLTINAVGNYEAQCRVCKDAESKNCTSFGMNQ